MTKIASWGVVCNICRWNDWWWGSAVRRWEHCPGRSGTVGRYVVVRKNRAKQRSERRNYPRPPLDSDDDTVNWAKSWILGQDTGVSFEIPISYLSDEIWCVLGISCNIVFLAYPLIYPPWVLQTTKYRLCVWNIMHHKLYQSIHPYWCWAIAN